MNITRFTPQILLLAIFVWVAGCTTPNPLASWRGLGLDPNSVDKAIRDDYQGFIQKLPPNQRGYYIGKISFFEDGTGQHAVSLEIFKNGSNSILYALIYDKDDKRIKIVKYGDRRYQS